MRTKVITHNVGGFDTIELCQKHSDEFSPPNYYGVLRGLHSGSCAHCEADRLERTPIRSVDDVATDAVCERYHSGSHRLIRAPKRAWECEGCNTCYSHVDVARMQEIG